MPFVPAMLRVKRRKPRTLKQWNSLHDKWHCSSEPMGNELLKMFILVLGFLLALFALAWAIALSLQGQLAENSGSVVIIIVVGIILMITGWKK